MPKITYVDNPNDFSIKKKTEFQFHRNTIVQWKFIKTCIWGNHIRNYYKISSFEDFSINEKMKGYFGEEYVKQKKKLEPFFKYIEKHTWIPIDKLYIRIQLGTFDVKLNDIQKQTIDIANRMDRNLFFEQNVLTKKDFIIWLLYIADFEGIQKFADILDKQFNLLNKFEMFSRNDMLPEDFKNKFNELINKLDEANIEPIDELNMQEFYNFVTHPSVSSISTSIALEKLFFIVSQSQFLKGMNSNGFKPSLRKYTEFLDDIFKLKYNNKKNLNISKFRPLKENEVKIFDEKETYIKDDYFIPDSIKEKYGLIPSWTKDLGNKGEKMTINEFRKFKEECSNIKDKSVLNILDERIKKLALPKDVAEKNAHMLNDDPAPRKKKEIKTPDEIILDILKGRKTQ